MSFVKKFFCIQFYADYLAGKAKISSLLLLLIISVISAIAPTYYMWTKALPFVSELEPKVSQFINKNFSDDLEITIRQGIVTTNVTEPYYIVVNHDIFNELLGKTSDQTSPAKVRLLAIDTKGSAENFEKYQTYALLTESNLVYYDDKAVKITSLRNIDNLTITKQIVLDKVKTYTTKYNMQLWAKIAIFLFPVLFTLLVLTIAFLVYLFNGLLVFCLGLISGTRLTYANAYRYSIVAGFLPSVIQEILGFVPYVGSFSARLDNLHTVVLLLIAYLGMVRMKQTSPNMV